MKRTWIKIKSGLLEPEHVQRMGAKIWVYLRMIDIVDWPTGKIAHWTDKEAAAALGMSERTVKDQRQGLIAEGYISQRQGFQCLQITLVKWTNPREYSGEIYNLHGDDAVSSCDEARTPNGDTHGNTHGDTPPQDITLGSHSTLHTREDTPKKRRAADPLFDAVAKACSVDPATAGASLGGVVATLRTAKYTPAEVYAFMAWWNSDEWRREHPPTIWKLKERIGYVRTPEGKKFLKRDPRALPEPTAAPAFIPPHSRFKCPTCSGYIDQHPDGCPYAEEAK